MNIFPSSILGFALGALLGGFFVFFILKERLSNCQNLLEAERATTQKLQNEFRLAASSALQQTAEQFLASAIKDLRQVKTEADQSIEKRKDEITVSVSEMKSKLDETQKIVRKFEDDRHAIYGKLENALWQVLRAEESIRIETGALKKALTVGSGIRGPLGQMLLQDILEENGLIRGTNFDTQVTLTGENDKEQRPDFVIYLPGGKRLAIDAKELSGEYILAQETEDPAIQKEHYQKLVANIRDNFTRLSRKEYQSLLDPEIPFVVMFVPSESVIRAAFSTDAGIFQEAAQRQVIIASPMTIIPLVYLIKHSWQQNQLAENARELGEAVEGLGERLYKFVEHLQEVRSGIKKSAESWDRAMGSWEKRVVPQLERTKNLGGKLRDGEDLTVIGSEITR